MSRKLLLKRNNTNGTLPTAAQIVQGELTINYYAGNEFLATKNSDNEIATFSSDTVWQEYHDNVEQVTAAALNDLNDTKLSISDAEQTYQPILTFDSEPTENSTNPVTSGGVYEALQNVEIDVDDELDDTSENPVQNKVVTERLEEMDTVIAAALNDLEDTKQDVLTFDSAPVQNSTNPVTSGGVYTALSEKADIVNGKVPASQLPSYVDDVVEGTMNNGVFTPTDPDAEVDVADKIYVDTTTNKVYRWSGSMYVEISATPVIDNAPTENSTNLVTSGGVYDALETKAPLASPALTGTPTAPTAAAGTNTTQIATTAFVQTALGSVEIDVDDELDDESENPVQNKVVTERISELDEVFSAAINDLQANKQDALTVDDELDNESENPIQNKAVTERLDEMDMVIAAALNDLESGKQDTLTFDSVPTENSTNPVTSGGVYEAVQDYVVTFENAQNQTSGANIIDLETSESFSDVVDAFESGKNIVGVMPINLDDGISARMTLDAVYIEDNGDSVLYAFVGALMDTDGVNKVFRWVDPNEDTVCIVYDEPQITVDSTLDDTSTNPVQNRAIVAMLATIDEVTAAAFNDLNTTKLSVSAAELIYQPKLTAGHNITITSNNTISSMSDITAVQPDEEVDPAGKVRSSHIYCEVLEGSLCVAGADRFLNRNYVPVLFRKSKNKRGWSWNHYAWYKGASNHTQKPSDFVTISNYTTDGGQVQHRVLVNNTSELTYYPQAHSAGYPDIESGHEVIVSHGKRQFYLYESDNDVYHNVKTKWGLAFIHAEDFPNLETRIDLNKLVTNVAPFYIYYYWGTDHSSVQMQLVL